MITAYLPPNHAVSQRARRINTLAAPNIVENHIRTAFLDRILILSSSPFVWVLCDICGVDRFKVHNFVSRYVHRRVYFTRPVAKINVVFAGNSSRRYKSNCHSFLPQNLFRYGLRSGSMGSVGNVGVAIRTDSEFCGTQYTLPFGARTPPIHL